MNINFNKLEKLKDINITGLKKVNFKHDINMFDCVFKDKSRNVVDFEKQIRKSLRLFAVIFIGVFAILMVDKSISSLRIKIIQSENESLATPERLAEIEQNKIKRDTLSMENQMLKSKMQEFSDSEKLTIKDIEDIATLQPVDLVISGFNYNEGTVNLSCIGNNELTGASFANSLRQSNKFNSVIYTGASKSEENFSFSITVELKEDYVNE